MFDSRPMFLNARSTGFYGYDIPYSCRFNDDDSAYLHWTPSGAGTEETFTISTWVKRCNLGSIMQIFNAAAGNEVQFTAANKLQFTTASATLLTTQVFRDVGGWYNIVIGVDTTQGTAANRVSIEINGSKISDFDTETYPDLDEVTEFGKVAIHHVSSNEGGTEEFDGYQAEFNYIDGSKVAASSFGQSKYGIWTPKKYSGSYGNNGFYLDFADSADLGKDVSGNNNDFTSSGLANNDQVEDSPTNNYCTLSSINKPSSSPLTDGNLNFYYASAGWITALSTMSLTSGKWYWELKLGSTDFYNLDAGVANESLSINPITTALYLGQDANSWGFLTTSTGTKYVKYTDASGIDLTGKTPTAGQIMQVALDVDAGKIWFGVDDTWFDSGDPTAGTDEAYSGLSGELTPGVSALSCTGLDNIINFGQLGFIYTPPTGYKALCSDNLPTLTIKDSSKGFNVVTYEGTGAEQSITDLGFQPDLVWIKNRDAADEHKLIDSVRGVTKELSSDSTNIESTDANGLTAFNSNGFTLGTGANGYNDNGESFVAWCFRMGAAYGFDIQTYEGTGVAHAENHNLGGVPELMIVKNLESVDDWSVYHYHALNKTDPETDAGELNNTDAWGDSSSRWNDTTPTSTQFTVGTYIGTNENGSNIIAYLWRSIEGFSKVGSFEGNGNADGAFVYCGFRPAYVLIKSIDSTSSWFIYDNNREGYNVDNDRLIANGTDIEGTADEIDLLSNGFKLRIATDPNVAETYVFLAYAEQPSKWSNSR